MATDPVAQFIARWKHSGAAERANYQLFLIELSLDSARFPVWNGSSAVTGMAEI